MTRGNYELGGSSQASGAHDNPAFTVEAQTPRTQNISAKETARKELDAFGEIPHSGKEDYLKFGFIVTFLLASFIVAVVITGKNF